MTMGRDQIDTRYFFLFFDVDTAIPVRINVLRLKHYYPVVWSSQGDYDSHGPGSNRHSLRFFVVSCQYFARFFDKVKHHTIYVVERKE